MSFGFSLGDLIQCTTLAVTTFQALKSAPAEFHSLSLEVNSLSSILKALTEEANAENSIIHSASRERQESLQLLLDNLKENLQKLKDLVLKCNSLEDPDKRRLRERLRFATRDKKGPREKLAVHISSLGIFLTSLTHSSLGRLEALVRQLAAGVGGADKTVSLRGFAEVDHQKAAFVKGWNIIGEQLWREGVRVKDMKDLEEEVTFYVRHLAKGGETFVEVDAKREAYRSLGRHFQSASESSKPPKPQDLPSVWPGTVSKHSAIKDTRIVEDEKLEKEEITKEPGAKTSINTDIALKRKRLEKLRADRKRYETERKRLEEEQEQAVAARKATGEAGITESDLISPVNVERRSDRKELDSLSSNLAEPVTPTAEKTSAEIPGDSVQKHSSSLTSGSLTNSDEADEVEELVKTFESLFELDDHATYNEPTTSPDLESNCEHRVLTNMPSSPYSH